LARRLREPVQALRLRRSERAHGERRIADRPTRCAASRQLYVDSDFALLCKCVPRNVARVRQVEAHLHPIARKSRLAVCACLEAKQARVDVQVAPEQRPEHASRARPQPPVLLAPESLGTGALLATEQLPKIVTALRK